MRLPILGRVTLLRWGIALVLLLTWEIAPRLGVIDPVFVPPFSVVIYTIIDLLRQGLLLRHLLLSTERALAGFLCALVIGPALGLLLGGLFPRLRLALEPVMGLLAQTNPVVLFHVILLFLGIGESTKIFIIAWLCTWPMAFSAIAGTRNLDDDLLRTARAFGLGQFAIFWKVVVPAAAPNLFTGIRISGGYAFVMLIAAEMMGASSGLGWFVVQSQESYNAPFIFAGATLITSLALGLDFVLKRLERKLIFWQVKPDDQRVLLDGLGSSIPKPDRQTESPLARTASVI